MQDCSYSLCGKNTRYFLALSGFFLRLGCWTSLRDFKTLGAILKISFTSVVRAMRLKLLFSPLLLADSPFIMLIINKTFSLQSLPNPVIFPQQFAGKVVLLNERGSVPGRRADFFAFLALY
jgi:hypothetical protein